MSQGVPGRLGHSSHVGAPQAFLPFPPSPPTCHFSWQAWIVSNYCLRWPLNALLARDHESRATRCREQGSRDTYLSTRSRGFVSAQIVRGDVLATQKQKRRRRGEAQERILPRPARFHVGQSRHGSPDRDRGLKRCRLLIDRSRSRSPRISPVPLHRQLPVESPSGGVFGGHRSPSNRVSGWN